MTELRYAASMSLDGVVAGPQQGPDHPLGVGGERLHDWMRELAVWRRAAGLDGGIENASTAVFEAEDEGVGAIIMGRGMFGGPSGPWTEPLWSGWWGPNPPFHLPVVVLTHHPRDPLTCEGGTTFTFVTEGLTAALAAARERAGDLDVAIAGGGSVAKQFLAAGLVDRLDIHLVPLIMGAGVRLFDGPIHGQRLQRLSVIDAPGVTHLRYRLTKPS